MNTPFAAIATIPDTRRGRRLIYPLGYPDGVYFSLAPSSSSIVNSARDYNFLPTGYMVGGWSSRPLKSNFYA